MTSALARKLQVRSRQRAAFLNAPAGYLELLGELPEGVTVVEPPQPPCDFVQLFARNSAELAEWWPVARRLLAQDGVLWLCYPKLSSRLESDLTRDVGWQAVAEAGYAGVASAAIDETWSAIRFKPVEHTSDEALVEAQYAGARADLRPIYERLREAILGLGEDVRPQVRKSYVAFARDKQFAAVQPSTRTRLDIGLKLPGVNSTERLAAAPGKVGGGSMTHVVSLSAVKDVDDELLRWLRAAYEGIAPE